jgi:hypothetical protein
VAEYLSVRTKRQPRVLGERSENLCVSVRRFDLAGFLW